MRNAFANTLIELAKTDRDLILLTGDLGFSVFEEFMKRFPKQYLNAGLNEQCMVGMAAGLALEGRRVFVYSIIPFLVFRALEQIRNDLCYQNLPVTLVGVGSGLAYGAEGGTHHAIEDLGVLTTLPNLTVFAPGDPLEVGEVVRYSYWSENPCYIRLNRAGDPVIHSKESITDFRPGRPLKVRESGRGGIVILATGNILPFGLEVWQAIADQGFNCSLYSFHTLKPVDDEGLVKILSGADVVVTLEEHVKRNGLFALVSVVTIEHRLNLPVIPFHLNNEYIHDVGDQGRLREVHGLTKDAVVEKLLQNE